MVLGFAVGCVVTALAVISNQAFADPLTPLSPHKPLADADPIVHAALANLDRRVSALEQSRSAVFVGVTSVKTTGKFQHRSAPAGLASAAALCLDAYGTGAHICTAQEIYASTASGILTNKPVPKSWIYTPAGNTTAAGLSDSCSGYTATAADRQATGSAFQWDLLPTGQFGPRFLGGTDAACTAQLPIACCL